MVRSHRFMRTALAGSVLMALVGGASASADVSPTAASPRAKPRVVPYVIGGSITAVDRKSVGTFAIVARRGTKNTRPLFGKIVVVTPGVLTRIVSRSGRRLSTSDLARGHRVTIAWRAPRGTRAVVVVVNAPRRVLDFTVRP